MIEKLHLYHQLRNKSDEQNSPSSPGILWRTCLRDIHFVSSPDTGLKGEYYHAKEAYDFLVEICCGIHSKIMGETEIFSQFKDFSEEYPELREVWNKLINDVKYIRTKYFRDNGSQTYGSFLNDHAKKNNYQEICFIGNGNLTRSILPLLEKFPGEISIFCRNPSPESDLKPLATIAPSNSHALLVVAAPVATELLENILDKNLDFKGVIDFRSLDEGPSIKNNKIQSIRLHEIFEIITRNQGKLKNNMITIKKDIHQRSLYWEKKLTVRPFGWEDLCVLS